MKIYIGMKTPNCLDYATGHLSEDEQEAVKKLASRWITYGEYVILELDTEKETLVVVQ